MQLSTEQGQLIIDINGNNKFKYQLDFDQVAVEVILSIN
jgi:hypothetical protein